MACHEGSIDFNGKLTYECKGEFIKVRLFIVTSQGVKGLKQLFNAVFFAAPSRQAPLFKWGFEYNTDTLRSTYYLRDWRTLTSEILLVKQHCSKWHTGFHIILDPTTTNFEKYDFGINWSPAQGFNAGVKHESMDKDHIQLGRFILNFNHQVSAA